MTQVTTQVRDDLGRLLVLDAAEVSALPWEPLRDHVGVHAKTLWRSGDVAVGLIRVDPGAEKPAHVHYGAHHHILVVSGSVTMLGRPLQAGAYLYVPPGVEHEVTAVGPDGCTFFYTFRPLETPPRPSLAEQPRLG